MNTCMFGTHQSNILLQKNSSLAMSAEDIRLDALIILPCSQASQASLTWLHVHHDCSSLPVHARQTQEPFAVHVMAVSCCGKLSLAIASSARIENSQAFVHTKPALITLKRQVFLSCSFVSVTVYQLN